MGVVSNRERNANTEDRRRAAHFNISPLSGLSREETSSPLDWQRAVNPSIASPEGQPRGIGTSKRDSSSRSQDNRSLRHLGRATRTHSWRDEAESDKAESPWAPLKTGRSSLEDSKSSQQSSRRIPSWRGALELRKRSDLRDIKEIQKNQFDVDPMD